jgi:hypothetical protein
MPRTLQPGEWHLPYINLSDRLRTEDIEILKKVSVARCARVSYLTHDGRQTSIEEDEQLYDRLLGSQPLHASPAEHQATPDIMSKTWPHQSETWEYPEQHGNLIGWRQLRKMLPGEFVPG